MIGPTASTQVAILAPSFGRSAMAFYMDLEAPAFCIKYWILFIKDCRRYCRV